MATEKPKTRLAAILFADVQSFSRLAGEDKTWAEQTLGSYLEVTATHIREYNGRVVEAVGDKILAEFANAVEAVQAALAIQKELKVRNAQVAENQRMEFRIGVNLGDVTDEGDTISGEGVQVAAKVESVSAAGGIGLSGSAYEQLKSKLALRCQYLGTQSVKNIEKPVRIYRVLIEAKGIRARWSLWKGAAVRQWERLNPAVKVLIALAAIANGVWHVYPWFSGSSPRQEGASKNMALKEKGAYPIPDQPSIAVLPFVNLSGDPKQEFFSDGITEDIITALSKKPTLLVIARNSTFTYKGKPVKVKQVSEELGVRYVLEGSVQKSGDRIRVTAQLIDAPTGHHLWAERYDRDLKGTFAVQDEVVKKILMAMHVKLTAGEDASWSHKYFKGQRGLDCYLKVMEGWDFLGLLNVDANRKAEKLARETMALCPENPLGYLILGWVHWSDCILESTKSPRESFEQAMAMAQKTLAMDDSAVGAHDLLCSLYPFAGAHDRAIAAGERAVALEPNGAIANEHLAWSLFWAGRPQEAIPIVQKAIRLNPLGAPSSFLILAHAYASMGRFEEAVSTYKKVLLWKSGMDIHAHLGLAASCVELGREKEARAEAAEVLRIKPGFTLEAYAKTHPYKDQSKRDRYFSALRKAGLN